MILWDSISTWKPLTSLPSPTRTKTSFKKKTHRRSYHPVQFNSACSEICWTLWRNLKITNCTSFLSKFRGSNYIFQVLKSLQKLSTHKARFIMQRLCSIKRWSKDLTCCNMHLAVDSFSPGMYKRLTHDPRALHLRMGIIDEEDRRHKSFRLLSRWSSLFQVSTCKKGMKEGRNANKE